MLRWLILLFDPLLKNRQLKKYVEKELEILSNEGIKKVYKLVSFNEEKVEVQEATIKMLGKLRKTTYGKTSELSLSDIKEIKPYINF